MDDTRAPLQNSWKSSMWSLLLVIAGGIIGLVGSLQSAFFSHDLGVSEARRAELVSAYAEWSGEVTNVIKDNRTLWLFDHIENRKEHGLNPAVHSNPAGKSREELAEAARRSASKLSIAETRLMLLEASDKLADAIAELSEITRPDEDDRSKGFDYFRGKELKLVEFVRKLNKEHPVIIGRK